MATTWRPDTCDCVLTYSNDEAAGHPVEAVHFVCAFHQTHAGKPQAHLSAVRAHNSHKNLVHAHVEKYVTENALLPSMEGVQVRYQADKSTIEVDFHPSLKISDQRKASVQSAVDAKFSGRGIKVI